MPAGLQVFRPNGELVLDLTDRLSKFAHEGTVNVPSGHFYEPPWSTFIPVSGMNDSGDWAVFVTSSRSEAGVIIGNGGFTVWGFSGAGGTNTVYYTVYRN